MLLRVDRHNDLHRINYVQHETFAETIHSILAIVGKDADYFADLGRAAREKGSATYKQLRRGYVAHGGSKFPVNPPIMLG